MAGGTKLLLTLSQLLQPAAQLQGLCRFGLLHLRQALLRMAQGAQALLLLEMSGDLVINLGMGMECELECEMEATKKHCL